MRSAVITPRNPNSVLTMAQLHLASDIESNSAGVLNVCLDENEQGKPCFWFELAEASDDRYTMPDDLAKEAVGFVRMMQSRLESAMNFLRSVPECLAEIEALEKARAKSRKKTERYLARQKKSA